MSELTRDEAIEVADKASRLGVRAVAKFADWCPTNPDGSYTGEILQRYYVVMAIDDARTGNGVVHTVREAGADIEKIVNGMRSELQARAKETRARIRAERSANRS